MQKTSIDILSLKSSLFLTFNKEELKIMEIIMGTHSALQLVLVCHNYLFY